MLVTAKALIENPRQIRPHVVLLGAGASRAAFPNGDASGHPVPIMSDLVDNIRLHPLIDRSGIKLEGNENFEAIYSELLSTPAHTQIAREIERRIDDYFSNLALPNQPTIYDYLLVSLREKDAVLTFNWDPFLFDAYRRNHNKIPLPEIFFLHGNVRIGACREHDEWGARDGWCTKCHKRYTAVPLLYPVTKKDYSKDEYIRRNWDAAKVFFREAFTITIFGYGAPNSDKDAVDLLRHAWFAQSERAFEHIEIIDTDSSTVMHRRWSPFTPTLHCHLTQTFEQSRIARWPRRSCESLFYPMNQGLPCEDFPLPRTASIAELQAAAAKISRYEDKSKE